MFLFFINGIKPYGINCRYRYMNERVVHGISKYSDCLVRPNIGIHNQQKEYYYR